MGMLLYSPTICCVVPFSHTRLFFILEYGKGVGPQGPQEKLQSEGALAPLGPQTLGARALLGPQTLVALAPLGPQT